MFQLEFGHVASKFRNFIVDLDSKSRQLLFESVQV